MDAAFTAKPKVNSQPDESAAPEVDPLEQLRRIVGSPGTRTACVRRRTREQGEP